MFQMFAKTALSFSFALLVSGCASAPTEPSTLYGKHTAGDSDSSVALELKADKTYTTKASGLLSFSHGGKWSLNEEVVRLKPNSSSQEAKSLAVRIEDGRVYLVETASVEQFDDGKLPKHSSMQVFRKGS